LAGLCGADGAAQSQPCFTIRPAVIYSRSGVVSSTSE
jgi:hypothetical protein